jgi:hypothetical protein
MKQRVASRLVAALVLSACSEVAETYENDIDTGDTGDTGAPLDAPDNFDVEMRPDIAPDLPDLLDDAELAALLQYTDLGATHFVEDFAGAAISEFWRAPWPSDLRARDGVPDLQSYPNPDNNSFVDRLLDIAESSGPGFGVSSAVYLPLSAPLDVTQLPSVAESRVSGSAVILLNVDRNSDEYGRYQPIDVRFVHDGGKYGGRNTLVAIPYQGVPLRESTRYALVATTALRDNTGVAIKSSALAARLLDVEPQRIGDIALRGTRDAIDSIVEHAVPAESIAGFAVFTTGAPTAGLRNANASERSAALISELSEAVITEQYPSYCVVERTARIRNWQHGEPPFEGTGGEWRHEADGSLLEAEPAPVRIWFTIPSEVQPEIGWETAVFVRTGGGGDRPLIDRGVRAVAGGDAPAGSGLADTFAAAGYVGVMIDGPHGGERNPTRGDEQFLMFNIANPIAMRDNIRESALELAVFLGQLETVIFGITNCDGTTALKLSPRAPVLFGHSMGATVAPLVAAVGSRSSAVILSGAGGSWTNNILFKQLPIPTRPVAEFMLGYRSDTLSAADPVLNLLQWVGEPADPQVYAREVAVAPNGRSRPRSVLMMQGVADTYILPPIANALSLSLGVTLLGDALESEEPESAAFDSLVAAAAAVGQDVGPEPVDTAGNVDALTSALLVQYREDGIEDGHEVVFQLDAPKLAICSFLVTLAREQAPSIVAGISECE